MLSVKKLGQKSVSSNSLFCFQDLLVSEIPLSMLAPPSLARR